MIGVAIAHSHCQ